MKRHLPFSIYEVIMNIPVHHAYHKVGTTSNDVPRVWMQGEHLARAGFQKGTPYLSTYDTVKKVITLKVVAAEADGSRNVSGRKKKGLDQVSPIIELANSDLAKVTGGATSVRADFFIGEIKISIHHLDTKLAAREQRLKNHLAQGYITKGVLCSGIGVSTAASHDGLAALGIESRTKFLVDRERQYNDIAFQNNHAITSDTKIIESYLEELEPELLGFIDELHFSLPCSPHGNAGRAVNGNKTAEEHIDSSAILGLIRVIDHCQPAMLYSENVLMAKNSATYTLLISILTACNYEISEIELSGKDTGSLESRPRWWFVATSKGLGKLDIRKNFPAFEKEVHELGDILDDIPANSDLWKFTAEKKKRAAKNKEKGNGFKLNLVTKSAKSLGVIGRHYLKDRNTEPHLIGTSDKVARLLTVNEIAKSQSVPLSLVANCLPTYATQGLGQGIDYRQGMGLSFAAASAIYLPIMDSLASNKNKAA